MTEERTELFNAIYLGVLEECERRQQAGELQCTGHNLAQEIVEMVSEMISLERTVNEAIVLNAVRKATYAESYRREKGNYSDIVSCSQRMAKRATENVKKLIVENPNIFASSKQSFWRNLFR